MGACGGGGGGDAPPIISAPTAIDTPSAQFLYANFADFAGAEQTSFVIDTATGQIRHFDDDTALIGFLNKQPDSLIAPMLAYLILRMMSGHLKRLILQGSFQAGPIFYLADQVPSQIAPQHITCKAVIIVIIAIAPLARPLRF